MKKNMIALMLSIVMVVGSVGGSSVFAAESTAQEASEISQEEVAEELEEVSEENEEADAGVSEKDTAEEDNTQVIEEDLSEVTELEQSEEELQTTPNSKEVEDSSEDVTETVEPATEEPLVHEDDKENIETNVLEAEIEENATSNDANNVAGLENVWFGSFLQDQVTDQSEIELIKSEGISTTHNYGVVSGVQIYCDEKGHYFRFDPVEWIIIRDDGNSYTLLSKKVLWSTAFSQLNDSDHFWEGCSLRSYLNSTFYDLCFSDEEKNDILETTVANRTQTYEQWVNHEEAETTYTYDKVYLLHSSDLEAEASSDLVAYPTVYASSAGNAMDWWLRGWSGWYYGNERNSYVSSAGSIKDYYPTYTKGIRPVIQVRKDAEGLYFEEPEKKEILNTQITEVSKYTIGKDTWSFRNYEEEVSYRDYAKFFEPITATFLSKKYTSMGRCNGMSQLIPSILEYGFPENMKGKEIHSYEKTGEVMQWLRYAQISQLLPDFVKEEALHNNDYNGLCKAIKNFIYSNGEPVLLSINGEHEVLPVSILKDTKTEVRFDIYDSNYPDNTDPDNGKPRYVTLILNGNNGNYSSCKYYLSEEKGGYNPIGEQKLKNLSYSVLTQRFISGYLSKDKADLCSVLGANANIIYYKLLHVKGRTESTFDGITELYPIHIKAGEDIDSSLYWIKDEDDQLTINDVEAGNTVTLVLPENSISITASEKADISLMVNNENSRLEASMDTSGEVKVSSLSGTDEITEISSILTGENTISVDIKNGEFITCGVSDIEIEKTVGEYNDGGELEGSSAHYSATNIETANEYTIDLAEISDKKSISDASVAGIQNSIYSGKAVVWDLKVKYEETILTEGTDYEVSYENNTNPGTATVAITGIGSYTGTVTKTFLILPSKTTRGDMFNLANNVKVTWKEVPGAKYYKVYREGITDPNETQTEPVIVTERLIGWDKEPGLTNGHAYRYKIVASLTGKDDDSGDSPLSYSKVMYRLKTVVIRGASNTAPGKVTVKYDKTTTGDSYVLQWSEYEDMTNAKTKVVIGANNTSYSIGGLKKGKTYYISIRVRKKVDGIDYYTTFGVPRKVTVTK